MGLWNQLRALWGLPETPEGPAGEPQPTAEERWEVPKDEPPAPVTAASGTPLVVTAGDTSLPGSGWQDYCDRETGAQVQARQRTGAFRLHTEGGEEAGEAGDYWVRPPAGPPRVVRRERFEARFMSREAFFAGAEVARVRKAG